MIADEELKTEYRRYDTDDSRQRIVDKGEELSRRGQRIEVEQRRQGNLEREYKTENRRLSTGYGHRG